MIPAQPTPSRRLTYADYCLIPGDGMKHEIIDGVHFVSPAPRYIHQRIVVNLVRLLENWARETNQGEILVAPFDILLSDHDVVQPDVLYISDENRGILNEKNAQGAPDLLIEILSPSHPTYDYQLKLSLYQQSGVKEYWIIDPELEQVHVFRLGETDYEQAGVLRNEPGHVLTTDLLPGFSLEISAVFYRP